MMTGGYAGRVLRVDLSSGTCGVSELEPSTLEACLGGRGLAAKLLYDELSPGVDAFDPENRLLFFTGPLTGTRIPFTAKHVVVTKSPLTEGYTRSITGGYFSPELKFAGYDGLVVSGKAAKPVYLWIKNDQVQVRDAEALWGLTVPAAEAALRAQLGPLVRISSIGPAGEKRVRFAGIVNDTYRFAGRGGTGAVMGSKNLKAVVVAGSRPVAVAEPALLEKTILEAYQALTVSPGFINRLRHGAMETVPLVYAYNVASVRHYSNRPFDRVDQLDPRGLVEKYVVDERSCFACPHKCLKYTALKEGPYEGALAEGPKYETLCMFGPNCGNTDFEAIVKANEICASYGIDSASAGNVIAFAMECTENGILNGMDTDGIALSFGNGDAMVTMLQKIAMREGFGDILAEGVKRAAAMIGRGAERFAMHVKGQEMGSFEPRGYPAMGLAYATANRGACHMGPPFRLDPWWARKEIDSPERWATFGKAKVVVDTQNLYALLDSMMFCSFSRYGYHPDLYLKLFAAVTGIRFSWEEAQKLANSIYSLERRFNLREGFGAENDLLPDRFLEGEGALPLQKMLAEYYLARGWSAEGIPPQALPAGA